jgi:hypothetical protein
MATFMSREPLIKFVWGTFCRKAIVDKETNDTSIIDLLPGLQVSIPLASSFGIDADSVESLPNDSKVIWVAIGKITLLSEFSRQQEETTNNYLEKIREELNIELLLPDLDKQIVDVSILIEDGKTSTYSILVLDSVNIAVPSQAGSYQRNIEIIYKIEDLELGRVKLPVAIYIFEEEQS